MRKLHGACVSEINVEPTILFTCLQAWVEKRKITEVHGCNTVMTHPVTSDANLDTIINQSKARLHCGRDGTIPPQPSLRPSFRFFREFVPRLRNYYGMPNGYDLLIILADHSQLGIP